MRTLCFGLLWVLGTTLVCAGEQSDNDDAPCDTADSCTSVHVNDGVTVLRMNVTTGHYHPIDVDSISLASGVNVVAQFLEYEHGMRWGSSISFGFTAGERLPFSGIRVVPVYTDGRSFTLRVLRYESRHGEINKPIQIWHDVPRSRVNATIAGCNESRCHLYINGKSVPDFEVIPGATKFYVSVSAAHASIALTPATQGDAPLL
jgi:hypothetical protein